MKNEYVKPEVMFIQVQMNENIASSGIKSSENGYFWTNSVSGCTENVQNFVINGANIDFEQNEADFTTAIYAMLKPYDDLAPAQIIAKIKASCM